MTSTSWKPSYILEIEGLVAHKHKLEAENERLLAAIRDAHALIDNDLVIPWIMAHKLDAILGADAQERGNNSSEGGNGDEALPSSVQPARNDK